MRDHRDLIVWQKGMTLAVDVYQLTSTFPRSEVFGLSAQMRRSAISIISNIAEGAGRRTTKDFIAFLHVARGSLAELETQILLAQRLGLIVGAPDWTNRIDEMGRLVNGMVHGLKKKIADGTQLR
jgi:four helix bundle protein